MFLKKYGQIIGAFVLGCVVAGGGAVFADSSVSAVLSSSIGFKVDGVQKQLPDGYSVLSYQDHTYVPARFVAEALGANVDWDQNTNTVLISSNGRSISQSAKVYPVDVTVNSGPMKMHITQVTLDPTYKSSPYSDPINAVVLTVSVENTGTDTVSWYPDQSVLVMNTKEQADQSIIYSERVGGDFIGQVIKNGNVAFKVNSNLPDVNDIKLQISGASKGFTRIGQDTLTDIPLK